MRKSAWERFQQISKINERVARAYPGAQQEEIRKRTLDMAETIAKSARGDELEDEQTVESFVQLSLLLGPHITLDEKLKEAAETKGHSLEVVSTILQTARIDTAAANTYRRNHPQTNLIERDICEVTASELRKLCGGKQISLLAGCAPCQGFCSLTVKNKRKDPRNELVLQMATLIRQLAPTVVMMENVPGLEKRGKRIFRKFLARLRAAGYWPRWQVIQMADYGIPQSRRRLVLFAGRGFAIPFPKATHTKNPQLKSKLKKWLTLRDVIAKQPKPITMSKAGNKGGPRKHNWHIVRDLQPQVAARLNAAIPGKTWLSLKKSIRPKCHRGDYNGFTNVYGRMSWQQTPVTMTGGCTTACKGRFGHPNKSRTTISVREAALIQSFPRGYKFDTDCMEAVCEMIGNAVPPKFARVAGKHILEELEKCHEPLAR